MRCRNFATIVAALLALAAIAPATPAKAQAGVAAGVLSCNEFERLGIHLRLVEGFEVHLFERRRHRALRWHDR